MIVYAAGLIVGQFTFYRRVHAEQSYVVQTCDPAIIGQAARDDGPRDAVHSDSAGQ